MAELTPRMKELVQPYLAGIEPYDPNFTPTRINLSANENTCLLYTSVLLSRRHPEPLCARDARLHPRGRRARLHLSLIHICGVRRRH